jgi:hypothetical protein
MCENALCKCVAHNTRIVFHVDIGRKTVCLAYLSTRSSSPIEMVTVTFYISMIYRDNQAPSTSNRWA